MGYALSFFAKFVNLPFFLLVMPSSANIPCHRLLTAFRGVFLAAGSGPNIVFLPGHFVFGRVRHPFSYRNVYFSVIRVVFLFSPFRSTPAGFGFQAFPAVTDFFLFLRSRTFLPKRKLIL